jgi:hypothetical protein
MDSKDVVLPLHGLLLFKPNKNISQYGFVINFPSQSLKISFELSITLKHFVNQELAVYEVDRKNFYINNRPPDIIMYEIADKMAAAIFPVVFTVNQNLEIVNLENHKEITSRCEQTKAEIAHYYIGKVSENILTNFTNHYSNPSLLAKQLQKDWWYFILFPTLYQYYGFKLYTQKTATLAFQDHKLDLEVFYEIEKQYNQTGKLILNLKSEPNKKDQASYQARYILNPEVNTIASAVGTIQYLEDDTLETVQFECYQLNG